MANFKLNDYKYDKIILRIQWQSYYTLAVCRSEFCNGMNTADKRISTDTGTHIILNNFQQKTMVNVMYIN